MTRILLVANPDNRRVSFFTDACELAGLRRPRLLPWEDFGRDALESALHESPEILRIESPGEDFAVERQLIAEGAEAAAREGRQVLAPSAALSLREDLGRVCWVRQFHLGFVARLRTVARALNEHPSVTAMTTPQTIEAMFHKGRSQRQLHRAGVPVPAIVGNPDAIGSPAGYDELRALMAAWGHDRVFLKLHHGSSASGVIAYSTRRREFAITTLELVPTPTGPRFYNSLRLRRYSDVETIRQLCDFVCQEGAQVEQWVPKARLSGRPFDFRVLVIAGEPRHTVARIGRGPLTNLHLGNDRGDMDKLHRVFGSERVEAARQCAAVAARVYPDALYCGVDVALRRDDLTPVVLEVNAFGDLLPNLTHLGQTPAEAEIDAMLRRLEAPRAPEEEPCRET